MGLACTRPGTSNAITFPQKVLLLGNSGAGKTTLLYGWKLGCDSVVKPIPTDDFNVEQLQYNRQYYIVWDLSGASYYRQRWRQFYHGTNILVFVIDGSDKGGLESLKSELNTIVTERDLSDIPCLIVFNKSDLSGETNTQLPSDIVPKRPNVHVISCCAKDENSCKQVLQKINDISVNSKSML